MALEWEGCSRWEDGGWRWVRLKRRGHLIGVGELDNDNADTGGSWLVALLLMVGPGSYACRHAWRSRS